MHTLSLRRAAALALGAAALAAPSIAQADTPQRFERPNVPPPDGQVEHVVRKHSFSGSYEIRGVVPRTERIESWVTADRSRQVHTDWASGKLRAESVDAGGVFKAFNAETNEIVVSDSPPGGAVDTLAEEGELIRRQVEMGWFAKTGDTTYLGRPAIELASTGAGKGDTDAKLTVIADAETYAPYVRTASGTSGGQSFEQRDEVVSFEVVDAAGQESNLRMSAHPGAKEVTPAAVAKRALAAKRRALRARKAAKRRAAARRAAARRAAARR